MLSKNQRYTVTIDGLTTDGLGVARIDGQVVFVKNAIRGEKCDILIMKVGKTAAWAKSLTLHQPSPERVEPDCPHFGKCGGCDFRHMTYDEELREKKLRVEDAFQRIGGLDLKVSEILGADSTLSYRNKAQYPVANGRHGFYRARTHQLISIDRCLLQTPEADMAANVISQWMSDCGVSSYDEETKKGLVRHIYIRSAIGTGQMMVCIVAAGDRLPKVRELIYRLQDACPEFSTLVLNVNKRPGNAILGDKYVALFGPGYIEDELMGLRFRLSPGSFYQVNRDQTQKLYARAIQYAAPEKSDTVLDLYCGIGTITLSMSAAAGQVIGAEIVPSAVENAVENAENNGITNARFILADAGEAAKKLADEGLHPTVVTVDPPRKGLSAEVIEAIVRMAPDRVVYVSCDPATLARDLKLFVENSYTPQKATAVDMFPRCAHVETVVLLSK